MNTGLTEAWQVPEPEDDNDDKFVKLLDRSVDILTEYLSES